MILLCNFTKKSFRFSVIITNEPGKNIFIFHFSVIYLAKSLGTKSIIKLYFLPSEIIVYHFRVCIKNMLESSDKRPYNFNL